MAVFSDRMISVRDQQFADWLVRAREQAGLGQEELAELVGVDPNTVSRWERGENLPRTKHRRRLEDALARIRSEAPRVGEQETSWGAPRIPLYRTGHIAGTMLGDAEETEPLDVTEREARQADAAFRLHGDSMEPFFLSGDIVGIRKQETAHPGQLVVALADQELTFKELQVVDGRPMLVPFNTRRHRPLFPGEVRIIGVYRWLRREGEDGHLRLYY